MEIKTALLITLFLVMGNFAVAQSNEEKALALGRQAINLMDEGKLDESIDLMEQAKKLDPDKLDYPYEIAYALYSKGDYPKAIEILNILTDHKDVTDVVFQLLGNAYDMVGEPDHALEIYKKGMARFPGSGKFHLESGVIKYQNKEYNDAITFWENGIKVSPNYASNYYRLSKVFALTEERIWALIYGEYFMLLEPNTQRTEEISKLLYENYQKSYESKTDSTGQFHLTEKGFQIAVANKKDLKKKLKNGILPFEGTFATIFAAAAIKFKDSISIGSIYDTRQNFLELWFNERQFDKNYPNKLFDYQNKIQASGFFKAYTYWMLSKGNPPDYEQWYSANEKNFTDFANWFNENRIVISEKDFNSRKDYE